MDAFLKAHGVEPLLTIEQVRRADAAEFSSLML
jgi:hypothetical protein